MKTNTISLIHRLLIFLVIWRKLNIRRGRRYYTLNYSFITVLSEFYYNMFSQYYLDILIKLILYKITFRYIWVPRLGAQEHGLLFEKCFILSIFKVLPHLKNRMYLTAKTTSFIFSKKTLQFEGFLLTSQSIFWLILGSWYSLLYCGLRLGGWWAEFGTWITMWWIL